jgi:hypothetical protein
MMVSGGVVNSGGTGELTARKVKHLVADLDEKLSDRGGSRDVEEGGSPRDSSSGEDESVSDADDQGQGARSLPQHRSDSRFELRELDQVS